MARKKDLTVDKRIKQEEQRLRQAFEGIDEDNKAIIDGLIQRAAYMRVTLEDWERDIMKNGAVEMFTQSPNTPPYERERPVGRLYNTMNRNYQNIIKQLSELVPKPEPKPEEDGFEDFLMKK